MRHDQLFKKLLEKFLRDFLELFFPDVAARLDFGTVQFLDKELTIDFPRGTTRAVDVVARLETHQGEPEIVLVHVEIQSRPEKDFARRMFEYSVLLWHSDQAPIFPVVLYLQGGKGLTDEEYRLSLFGRELFRFRYASVGLAHLEAEEYFRTGPLGAGLAALMAGKKAGDPVVLRTDMERRVAVERARRGAEVPAVRCHRDLLRALGRRAGEIRDADLEKGVSNRAGREAHLFRSDACGGRRRSKARDAFASAQGEIWSAFPGNHCESNGCALSGRARRSPRTYPLGDGPRRDGALGLGGSSNPGIPVGLDVRASQLP